MYSNFSKYHEALQDLIKSLFNGIVLLSPVDEAFEYANKNNDGKLKFPMISLYPNNSVTIDKKNTSFPSYKEGLPFQNPLQLYDDNGNPTKTTERLAKNSKFLYIIIGYQIDVWRYW